VRSDFKIEGFAVDLDRLPANFPTHRHEAEFWEALGRGVATFGFLEEVLGKAIFSVTATRQIPFDHIQIEYEKWLATLERALVDPLGGLIDYGSAARKHQNVPTYLNDLLKKFREAAVWRNTICHGSWRAPDGQGRSLPLYVDRKRGVFETPIDTVALKQLQRHVAELACAVVNTVTQMGYQFPGSKGPGKPVFGKPCERAKRSIRRPLCGSGPNMIAYSSGSKRCMSTSSTAALTIRSTRRCRSSGGLNRTI